MKKQTGALLLVAGTCIGSGIVALPMMLSKIGVLPSFAAMLLIWLVMHYSSLVNLELNLQAGKGLSLGELGAYFSGPTLQNIGYFSLKSLSYTLLAAYIYGGTSVSQKLSGSLFSLDVSTTTMSAIYAVVLFLMLLSPIKVLDYLNRFLFLVLMGIFLVLVGGLLMRLNWQSIPWISPNWASPTHWIAILPIVFTSFGFQVIFHILTDYCDKNATALRKAFFWGSFLAAAVYCIWTFSVLGVIYHEQSIFYEKMVEGSVEVGDLIHILSHIAQWPMVQILVWWVSLLAIVTSVLGIGIGLVTSIQLLITPYTGPFWSRPAGTLLTILPPYIVALLLPNAFIAALGFAGMILAVIALLLPIYLLVSRKFLKLNYSILNNKILQFIAVAFGILIMMVEITHMIN